MITISEGLRNCIIRSLRSYNRDFNTQNVIGGKSIFNNDLYSSFIKVDFSNVSITEIPSLLMPSNISVSSLEEKLIYIDFIDSVIGYSSIEPMIKNYFYRSYDYGSVTKVKHRKDNKCYYIGKGIILNGNKDVLINICFNCTFSSLIYGKYRPVFKDCTLKINPKVFIDQKDYMNSFIIKKIIPFFLDNDCQSTIISSLSGFYECGQTCITEDTKVKVELSDFSNLFIHPKFEQCNDINQKVNEDLSLENNLSQTIINNFGASMSM